MERTYKTEFPDFDAPDDCAALAARGWRDESWHNDTCPNFTFGESAALFLDYIAPELREVPETVERFTVYPIGPDGYESARARHFTDLASAAAYGEALALARADYLTGDDEEDCEPCPIHRQPVNRCPDSCEFHR